MTTKITVEVPTGANYKVEVQYKENPGSLPQVLTAMPGDKLEFHIWAQKRITDIREIPI